MPGSRPLSFPGDSMPELNDRRVELRMVWAVHDQRFWYRQYMLGRTLPTMSDFDLMLDIKDYFNRMDGYFDLWINTQTITAELKQFKLQVIYPQRQAAVAFSVDSNIVKGRWICGNQPWNATCRVKLHSLLWTKASHWYQISPVPRFDQIASPTQEEYLAYVESLMLFISNGFTTVPGNIWKFAYRTSLGTYHPIDGTSVQLFMGNQITRRRII